MELHVCYGTFGTPKSHPCKKAHVALTDAGYEPRVVRTGGCYGTDPLWKGRRAIKRATGNYKVPTLFLDDGTIIDGSDEIVAWAGARPAHQREREVTEPTRKGELTLSTVTEALGALAAVAGLIFVTGGAVLALRLAFERLPALGVVGQLPNGFLFSIGATQVVIPALAAAALHVIYAAHRNTSPTDRPSVWDTARRRKRSRWRHLIAASVLPVALVLPGAVLAFWHNEHRALAIVVAGAAVIAAVCAILLYRRTTKNVPEAAAVDDSIVESEPTLLRLPRYYFPVLSGGIIFLAIGVAAGVFGDGSWQFLWLLAAWAGCLSVVLGYLLLRGEVGDHYREDSQKKYLFRAQLVLSLAVAALVVPGLICFWAAWPLERATVCTSGATGADTPFTVEGVFVGETGDRVYVGDTEAASPSIVSIPQSAVTRTAIGDESTSAADCATDLTPQPTR